AVAAARPTGHGTWFYALVLVPLISYSILSTLFIIMLLTRTSHHPLEMLPDLEGEGKGASKTKTTSVHYKLPSPEIALPARLRTSLGGTVAVGDLEVTP